MSNVVGLRCQLHQINQGISQIACRNLLSPLEMKVQQLRQTIRTGSVITCSNRLSIQQIVFNWRQKLVQTLSKALFSKLKTPRHKMNLSIKFAAVLLAAATFACVPLASASDFEHPTVAHLTSKNYEESVRREEVLKLEVLSIIYLGTNH